MARVVQVDVDAPDPALVEEAAALLRSDRLVAFPTETVYGLGGHALHPAALNAIFAAKGRPTTHPLIAHVADVDGAMALAAGWPKEAAALARAFWPGPLTLVLPRRAEVPPELTGGKPTVAIRLPASPLAWALVRALGAPIAAPSANRYQALSPTEAAHVVSGLGDRVPLVLDGGSCRFGLESTVLDLSQERPTLLRPGALPLGKLRQVVPSLIVGAAGSTTAKSEEERRSPGQDRLHYAPHTRLHVLPSREAALRAATADPKAGLLLRGAPPDRAPSGPVRVLPDDPEGYGRRLFGALHELDALGLTAIFVEAPPPKDEAWLAVADRLARACGKGDAS